MRIKSQNLQRLEVKRIFTRRDLGLLFILALLAGGGWLVLLQQPRSDYASVHLWDGTVSNIDLTVDQEVLIPGKLGPLTAVVSQGRLWVSAAPCPEQICTRSGSLPDQTTVIICVPSGVLIEAERKGADYDALSW